MAKRTTEDGRVIPRGVCADKDRPGYWRATRKGLSIRCKTLDEAIALREKLVREKAEHPKYSEWFKGGKKKEN